MNTHVTPIRKSLATGLILLGLAAPALNAQVVGYWQFNEKPPGGASDTTAGAILDSSGNGHNGTTAIPMAYVGGSSAYGNTPALTFTLSPDNVVVPDPAGDFNFSPAQSMTFEALVRTFTIGQDSVGAIMNKQGANPGEWWWRINATGKQQFWIDDGVGGSKNVNGSRVLNDGQWHHLAAVYDAAAQQVRVYVDYALDGSAAAVYSTSGIIGNTNDLWLGAYQAANRQFDGDMDFARVSMGALDPTNFVRPVTYVSDISPTNDASFLPPSTVASFSVQSPVIGVAQSNIVVVVNGVDISNSLGFSGDSHSRTVTLPALSANVFYRVNITVTDLLTNQISQSWEFNTFATSSFSIEGEDYNFSGGQFIDNPQLSSNPAGDNYLDRIGVEGIDFHQTNTPVLTLYRIGDAAGTGISQDALRQAYIDAQMSDPGVADYMLRDNANTEWVNYTRTFPAGTYHVYARLSKPGTVPVIAQLDEVIAGSTTASQTLAPIGTFSHAPTGSDADYEFVPLTDALGNEAGLPLSGERTLRLTFVSGGANVNLNYFVFVPITGTQTPFLAAVTPAAGAGNEASNAAILGMLRNGDTSVVTNTISLKLDGVAVAPAISGTPIGANVSYTPSVMSTGLHTVTLVFTDSSAASVTNQWQFYVANRAVRGYWKFNEKTPGNYASTTPGAILDASGNARNGTVNVPNLLYVPGSFNYSNTPALRFTTGPDYVVVPDAAGNFIFTNSFTFEAVVRSTNTTSTTGAILAKNGTGDGEGEFWWRFPGLAGGKQRVGMNNQVFLSGTNTLNDGGWHHIAVVYDQANSQVRLYADYVVEGVFTNVFDRPIGRPGDLTLGSFLNGGSDLDGDIDFIRISDGALTPAQFVQTTIALQPVVKTLTPASGAKNVSPNATVSAEFQNRDTSVVPGSLRLFIDGTDVTAGTTVSNTSAATIKISYVPSSGLANGPHTARVTFLDSAVPANSWTNSWSFTNLSVLPVLGFYQLNEKAPGNYADTNAGAIVDFSGNDRNGTVSSYTGLFPYVAGGASYGNTPALNFTVANTNHIAVPDPTGAFNWNPTQSVTLEAVLRTTTIGQASVGAIMAKQLAATPEYWWRINAAGTQQFNVNDAVGGAKSVSGTKVLNDGNWHHVAVIYDGQAKQLRAYVDYVQDGNTVTTTYTSTTSTIGNSQPLYIGRFQAGNRIFEGDIDMVRLTGAALDVSWFIPLGGVRSPVKLSNIARTGANITFSFPTEVGRSYVVQGAAPLGAAWTPIETIPGTGSAVTVSYSLTGSQQHFRVQTQ